MEKKLAEFLIIHNILQDYQESATPLKTINKKGIYLRNKNMKNKLSGIFICMLMIAGVISVNAISSDWNDTVDTNNYLSDPPAVFDLRNVNGENYVTEVKDQIIPPYGTCWAHGIMAAMESNLLITGNWEKAGEEGEPDLSESHIDWWNGFNTFNNFDVPGSDGLTVHWGAECRTATAYLTRGDGAVREIDAPYDEIDTAPDLTNPNYHYYYVNDIDWYDIGEDLGNMDLIKNKIMTYGAMNIAFSDYDQFLDTDTYTYYQPATSDLGITHDVALIGWDDSKTTAAPEKGAWLCKNSFGSSWGLEGYFWISYYDKWCCHYHDREWTASFQGVEPMRYNQVYYHDYHGWQDTFTGSLKAFNAFYSASNNTLLAVNFFTAIDNVNYNIRVYNKFENGQLKEELSNISGMIPHMGFHTVILDQPVFLYPDDNFYIYLELLDGGQPYDKTIEENEWWAGVKVKSISHPGESYYYENGNWNDFYFFDDTANFCIKGLAIGGVTNAPNTPTITGEIDGNIQTSYEYAIQATDPDQDDIKYFIDWGDSSNSGWIGSYNSGETVYVNHSWDEKDTYTIKVVAKDINGAQSDWGSLTVTMPYSYNPTLHFLERLFHRFPNVFPPLRQIMIY